MGYEYNPANMIDPDGLTVTGKFNRATGTVTLVDSDPKRGRMFQAYSGYNNDPNKTGGPIPNGDYAIVEEPWGKHVILTWFGLFKNNDGKLDDFIQTGEGKGRGGLRMHQYITGSNGCISCQADKSGWEKIAEWICGISAVTFKDADGILRTKFGEMTVIDEKTRN
jgi:hypothetical protein